MLEQQVVGWEEAENEDLDEDEEKHKRQKFADEQRMQLVTVLQKSDNDSSDLVLLNIYDSVQEEVWAKSKLLEKMQKVSLQKQLPASDSGSIHWDYSQEGFFAPYFNTVSSIFPSLLIHIFFFNVNEIP